MLVSVGCEVESEKNLRCRSPWQQPIYSDDIHRFCRYFIGAAPSGPDVFRAIVIERSEDGVMCTVLMPARTSSAAGGYDGWPNLERGGLQSMQDKAVFGPSLFGKALSRIQDKRLPLPDGASQPRFCSQTCVFRLKCPIRK
jgi:hypothetical protein